MSQSPPPLSPAETVLRIRTELKAGYSTFLGRMLSGQGVAFMLGALAGLAGNALYAGDYTFAIIFIAVIVLGGLILVFFQHRKDPHIIGIMVVHGFAGLLLFCSVCAFAQYRKFAMGPPELHAIMIPGNEPEWGYSCIKYASERRPGDWMAFALGSNLALTDNEGTVIKVRGQDIFSIQKSAGGISLSARIISADNKVIGQITNNELFVNPGNEFKRITDDWHTVKIIDARGQEVFYAHYLNRVNAVVRGRFYGHPPIVITDDRIDIAGATWMHDCFFISNKGNVIEIR